MIVQSLETLIEEVRIVFGRALTPAEIEPYAGRLPIMQQNLKILAAWSARLGAGGPAQIQQVVECAGTAASRAAPRRND